MQLRGFVKLRRQGNSYVITIPKSMLETLGWNGDDELFLEVRNIDPKETFAPLETTILQVAKTKSSL